MKQTKSGKTESHPGRYHHGDLRAALIRATDEILAGQGVEGFSMREAARRAGVSAAAPAHHFGSTSGLLTEVAALGFRALSRYLETDDAGMTPVQRLRMQAAGYVRFAVAHPGRFRLMFRRDLLSEDHEGLEEASRRAFQQLEATIRAVYALPADTPLSPEANSTLLATWSMVHGFAHLVLEGKLAHIYEGASEAYLLENVLPAMLRNQWPDA